MKGQQDRVRRSVRPLLVGLAVLLALAGLGAAALAQENQAQMSVEPPVEALEKGGPDFQVNILVDNVTNLAAFQFSLEYDSSVIKYVAVKEGDFLGSSGRDVKCLDPYTSEDGTGLLRFNCVTLGPPVSVGGKAGPNGSGMLATATFSPVGGGETSLNLTEGILVAAEIDEKGAPVEIETAVQSSSLNVKSTGGFAWALWGPIIGIVAAIVVIGAAYLAMRLRSSRHF